MDRQNGIRLPHLVGDFQRRFGDRFGANDRLRLHAVFLGEAPLLSAKTLFKQEGNRNRAVRSDRLRHLGDVGFKLFEPPVDLAFDTVAAKQLEAQCHASSQVVLLSGARP